MQTGQRAPDRYRKRTLLFTLMQQKTAINWDGSSVFLSLQVVWQENWCRPFWAKETQLAKIKLRRCFLDFLIRIGSRSFLQYHSDWYFTKIKRIT